MRTLISLVAVLCLLGIVPLLLVVGGVFFAVFLFGLFMLALVGVIAGTGDRTVRQHDPAMDPKGWRNGS